MNPEPVLSVIMPVFNGAAWLPESLASIRRQEVAGVELIVVDDGSTDSGAEEVRRYAPAARYFRQENQGAAAARNRGLDLARAGLIAFLDHDDVWPDGSLAARLQALQADPTAWFVLGRTRFLGAGGEHEPWVSPNLGAGLYRRELFGRTGRLNEACRLADDVDWFLRLRESGLPYVTLAEVTLLYRRGTGGITHGSSWRDPELLATLRSSLARRRASAGRATELPLLSGSRTDPRANGPVNHEPPPTSRIDIRPQLATSVWPTRAQLLLLRAALWDGAAAAEAWREWQRCENLRALDFSSWKLLPLAWSNLIAAGVQDEVLDECQGFYRYHWARNQLRLRQARGWVADLQSRGIPVVVLKGGALLADVYRDPGLRPMADTDLLVPVERADDVAAWLQTEGWRPQLDYLAWKQIRPEMQCSFGWQRGTEQLDLHWHVLHRCTDPAVTREFWRRARLLRLDGVETLQLCPEDTLLHVCSHGVQYSVQAPFRWLADAAWILRRHGADFDWPSLLEMARRTGTTLALRHGLNFAATELRLPVPTEVLAQLRAHRGSWWERADYRRTIDPTEGGRWMRAWNLARLLRRIGGRGTLHQRGDRMARFLCDRWEAPSLGAAALLLLKKLLRGHRGTFATDRGKRAAP